jgi:hypothetical protein
MGDTRMTFSPKPVQSKYSTFYRIPTTFFGPFWRTSPVHGAVPFFQVSQRPPRRVRERGRLEPEATWSKGTLSPRRARAWTARCRSRASGGGARRAARVSSSPVPSRSRGDLLPHIVGALAPAACFGPRRPARRRHVRPRPGGVCRAAQAHGTTTRRRDRLPFRVRPRRRGPALAWCPGHRPAQAATRAAAPTRCLAVPLAAMRARAGVSWTPGRRRRGSSGAVKGALASRIGVSRSAIGRSRRAIRTSVPGRRRP